VTVPFSLCLSIDTVRSGPLGNALSSFKPAAGEASILALQLLYETTLGPKSKYGAYFLAHHIPYELESDSSRIEYRICKMIFSGFPAGSTVFLGKGKVSTTHSSGVKKN